MTTNPRVTHNTGQHRFEITIDDCSAKLEYSIHATQMTIHHTYVPVELRGQKIAGKLAAAAFEFAAKQGLKVIPECSYIATYIKRHPETASLMARV